MYRFLSILLVSFIIINCSGKPGTDKSPTPEATGELFELYSPSSATAVFSGEEDNYIVGSIEDARLHDGQIYLVDGAADSKVLALSKQGALEQQIGRPGRGPGEYQHPDRKSVV